MVHAQTVQPLLLLPTSINYTETFSITVAMHYHT